MSETQNPSPITTLLSDIESATKSLSSANNASSYAAGDRKTLLACAKALVSALEPPNAELWRVVFAPQANAALRTSLELKIFDVFGDGEQGRTAQELAVLTKAEKRLIVRIMRALVASNVFAEVSSECYTHNAVSRSLSNAGFRTAVKGLNDMFSTHMAHLPSYLSSISYANPSDSSATLFNYATQTSTSMFAWLQTQPEKFALFSAMMATAGAGSSAASLAEFLPDVGPVGKEEDGPLTNVGEGDHVLVVDVGGGAGKVMQELRKQRADLKGRLVVQDLAGEVEAMGTVEGVEGMVHDFFAPQPVTGSQIYYFRHVFHDWPDGDCAQIMRHTAAAMSPRSRLLIADAVVPDTDASLFNALMDIGLMTIGGGERTEGEWRELLASAGLQVVSIQGPEVAGSGRDSLIGAVLGERQEEIVGDLDVRSAEELRTLLLGIF